MLRARTQDKIIGLRIQRCPVRATAHCRQWGVAKSWLNFMLQVTEAAASQLEVQSGLGSMQMVAC